MSIRRVQQAWSRWRQRRHSHTNSLGDADIRPNASGVRHARYKYQHRTGGYRHIICPNSAPPYGTINGYSVVEQGQFPGQAMLINQWMNAVGTVGPIMTSNVLQFVNVDTIASTHSAVGFKGEAFPRVPYTFPKAAASPTATAVSTTQLWSTGRIAPFLGSVPCYSQTFTLSKGVYYFGDLDYYNLWNFRDVLIVATPAPLLVR